MWFALTQLYFLNLFLPRKLISETISVNSKNRLLWPPAADVEHILLANVKNESTTHLIALRE